MSFVIPTPKVPSLAVAGGDRFPLRRVYCVGRNYAAHAREMGKDPEREPPFFFAKPADAVVPAGGPVPHPPETRDLHHEIELVVALGQGGAAIAEDQALAHVYGYGVGIDLTRRDLQSEAKKPAGPGTWPRASMPRRPAASFTRPPGSATPPPGASGSRSTARPASPAT